ncbi:MAG: single-stranded DNA-binding protein [Pseudomonadales bacterium]|nr:single-stranded DNA-binding protein [Pseudomonadales bacterium]
MLIKLVRIGRDAELRFANGKPLLNVSVVYDIGFGQHKKPQWLNLTLWGQQAEKVQPYFSKGKQIVIRADDIHIEEYNGKSSLKGTLIGFDFVQHNNAQDTPKNNSPTHSPQVAPPPPFDDIDDIPF